MKIKRGFLIIYPVESHEYLNCVPENEVFSKTEFYSSLKNKISDEEYENVWKFERVWKFADFVPEKTFRTERHL